MLHRTHTNVGYGCEAWIISKQAQKKLEAVEMWFLRRMMKISWMAKKSNDTVLKEAHTSRALVNKIRTRQTTFFGHVMRREKLEHLITTGMMEGKHRRGKQREKMTDGLVNWLGAGKVVEILKATRDRGIWKDMFANAVKHGAGWWWWWWRNGYKIPNYITGDDVMDIKVLTKSQVMT